MALPDDISLNVIVTGNKDATSLNGHLASFLRYLDKDQAYARYQTMNMCRSDEIIKLIFADGSSEATAKRGLILGNDVKTPTDFKSRLQQGANLVENNLDELLAFKSFPETFFHDGVAAELVQTKRMSDPERMHDRILTTGLIIKDAVNDDEDYGLARMLAIAESHKHRQRKFYTEHAVEFTLLTFSYFGAKASGFNEGAWFFLWRVFGSFMGLHPDYLHWTRGVAEERMKFLRKFCTWPPTQPSQTLLDTFIDRYYDKDAAKKYDADDDGFQKAVAAGRVSRRMYEYVKLKNRLPEGLPERAAKKKPL